VKRLAAETAMKRLKAKLDAVMLSSHWRVRLKSLNRNTTIEPEQKPRKKSHWPSTVNDNSTTANLFFVHIGRGGFPMEF